MNMEKEDRKLREYYERRAVDYEALYYRPDPQRQGELKMLADRMREVLADKNVLEVACGTGYWTRIIAEVARSVVAIDAAPSMLALAREKNYAPGSVTFQRADAYAPEEVPGTFLGGVANFWLSHVPKRRVAEFLMKFHNRLERGAAVFMADNVCVPGFGGELVIKDGIEDSYRLRELSDGSKHEVLKNYYEEDELRHIFERHAFDLKIRVGAFYWWLDYKLS